MKRLCLCLLFVVVISVGVSAAQDRSVEPKLVSYADAFENGVGAFTFMPDTTVLADLSGFTLQAGEQASSCAPSAESKSAWFSVTLPDGTLVIDTTYSSSTNYDTLVAVFDHSLGPIDELHEVACEDNTSGDKAIVSAPLPPGGYLVRVTCIGLCASLSLSISIGYVTDKTAPNDNINEAAPITLNKVEKSKLVAFATAGNENDFLSCLMLHSIWYVFTAPETGAYSFSTTGSILLRPLTDGRDTKLAVYVSSSGDPLYNDLTMLGCADDTFGSTYATISNLAISKGAVIYLRAGTFGDVDLLPASMLRVKVTAPSLSGFLANPGFEAPLTSNDWVLKNPTAGDGVSTDVILADAQVMKLNGAPNKNTTLKQTYDPAANGIRFLKDATLSFAFRYTTAGTTARNVKAILKISYSDGTPATKATRKLPGFVTSNFGVSTEVLTTLESSNVSKVTVSFKAKNSGGAMYLDFTSLTYTGDATRSAPSGVLPLPAPQG